MNDIINRLIKFREYRNWRKYHTLKNLSMALSVEVAELMELFQWEIPEEINYYENEKLNDEIADCFIYLLNICDRIGLDEDGIKDIINAKIDKNEIKYPIIKK